MKKYNFNKIEQYWQRVWKESGTYEPNLKKAKKPFYNLMMFPYPSAEGLHVGNMYAFTGADIYGRKKRMEGYDVFEPIGLDGFGIHSENYALKIGAHPMDQAKISEKRFYKQLEAIGNGFAWDERVETYDPNYYKWTQWVFTEMWRRGLAYRKKQFVNWCPSCKTVLADEQVIAGKCERCSSIVVKKDMEQWFFRITKYAEKLLGNLEKIDWSEKVKIAQRNWIGRSEGAELKFSILNSQFSIKVFTTRPDTLFGATYMVLAPEHPLISNFKFQISNYDDVEKYIKNAAHKSEMERIEEGREKTGVELKGIKAVNPANNEKIPVFVADYVLSSYGTGAIMAVPAHDERDFAFAKKFNLPIIEVISGGRLINSGKFNGMDSEKAGWEITKLAGGERKIQYRLRDWLISRQRYWGAPIPMIYCGVCASKNEGEQKEMPGWYAVPEKDLPVKLPYVKDFRPQGKGESPLASVKKFYETKCPHCGGKARRETDVSDTFLDSAWYYLRYPSVKEKNKAWNPEITKKWFPVNLYTGGAEHSVLHLLYVRFVAMTLHEAGKLHFEEPFPKFRAHGLLIKEGAKMSKSKGNVINPDEYIKNFGADSLRMYLMFLAPFEQGGDFRDEAVLGIVRFLDRVWNLCVKEIKKSNKASEETLRLTHRTIKKITNDIESLHYNTAISALMIFLNEFEKKGVDKENKEVFLKLLAPFAPHITEELWSELGKKTSIHKSSWPIANSKFLKEEDFDLVIQVNGKLRATIKMPRGASQRDAEKAAFGNENVNNSIAGQKPKKTIFVPNRLINFVI
ncbi:MAG: leucine--tRNA ligase [Patescibacteria group bacterium]